MQIARWLLLPMLVLGLFFPVCSPGKALVDKDKMEAYLQYMHSRGFDGEILVAEGFEILFQQVVGLASHENNIPLKKGATYRIASITKTFTGTLIAMAQQEQKLHVQDKASDYINDLSPKFRNITIEQLLSHTSGLPHNEGIPDYWLIKSKLEMSREQAIAAINALDLLFKPGQRMHYSSLGYYLLALILEKVYNDRFENILQTKILDRLQMTETGVGNDLKIIPGMASGYHLLTDDSLVVAPYRNYSMLKGAGDMYSTTTDLLTWSNSFLSNSILPKKTQDSLFIPNSTSFNKTGNDYACGWYIDDDTLKKQYHGGGTWGYSSYLSFYPDSNISILILSNVSTLPVTDIASDIEKIVFGKPFQIPALEKVLAGPLNLDVYTGRFISDENKMILSIIKSNDRLYAKLGDNPPFEIYPKGKDEFFGKKVNIVFTFQLDEHNMITGLVAEGIGKTFRFKKDDQ